MAFERVISFLENFLTKLNFKHLSLETRDRAAFAFSWIFISVYDFLDLCKLRFSIVEATTLLLFDVLSGHLGATPKVVTFFTLPNFHERFEGFDLALATTLLDLPVLSVEIVSGTGGLSLGSGSDNEKIYMHV